MPRATEILRVEDLTIAFPGDGGWRNVVDHVSLVVHEGERVALVGESGSGKSLTALATLGLVPPPGRIAAGTVAVAGDDLARLDERQLQKVRGGTVGIVFQEPATALNPVFSVGFQLREAVRLHHDVTSTSPRDAAIRLLSAVGLEPAETMLRAYPHQLSGGQQQRVMLALAIAGRPRLLVADEPTTALDLTTQAALMKLLLEMAGESGMALLLITHDLAVVANTVTSVLVMYAGELVEEAPVAELFASPLHPYTRTLLAAARREDSRSAGGAYVPEPGAWGPGCRFSDRCPEARPACSTDHPQLEDAGTGRRVRCPYALQGGPR